MIQSEWHIAILRTQKIDLERTYANAKDENVGLVIQVFFPELKTLQVRKGSHHKLLQCMQMLDFTFECIF